ncbi:uncharacterized protein LY89DRAFT_673116 [Mollisia scopiformis]|uniref:Uncharacterized protein n=1 Tax=Mollisia scopiformis TaxID=149040 RepID=A0A194WZH9_MOLSC|nr:uncharacterized protein LY89DRAFT_673116 [Mollisia scopiformis]KUJ13012.1 hypothetical protein LY89DRAFT_673116 [Mollisia scopiformis]
MMNSMQEYTTSIVFSCVGVLAFATCVVFGIWCHKIWLTYGFYVADFKKFDTELRQISSEATQMRKDVELDHTADCLTKVRNAELLSAADDCDNGLRIALCAWEDIMEPEEWKLDIESKGDKMIKGRRRSHGRFVIRLMRQKCIEGLAKRKGMEKELQSMYNEVMSRKIDLQSNLFNRRIASGHEIRAERTVLQPERHRGPSHVPPKVQSSLEPIVPNSLSALSLPTTTRKSSCPVPDIEGLRVYTKIEG